MTDVSRRSMIGASAVAAAAVGLPGIATLPASAAPGVAQDAKVTSASRLYTRTRWASLAGRWFTASESGRTVDLKLVSVGDADGARAGAESAFTLTFAKAKAGPEQATFSMARARFTATSLFLVPDEDRRTYTAVINSSR